MLDFDHNQKYFGAKLINWRIERLRDWEIGGLDDIWIYRFNIFLSRNLNITSFASMSMQFCGRLKLAGNIRRDYEISFLASHDIF